MSNIIMYRQKYTTDLLLINRLDGYSGVPHGDVMVYESKLENGTTHKVWMAIESAKLLDGLGKQQAREFLYGE